MSDLQIDVCTMCNVTVMIVMECDDGEQYSELVDLRGEINHEINMIVYTIICITTTDLVCPTSMYGNNLMTTTDLS